MYVGENEQIPNCPRRPFLVYTGAPQEFSCICPIHDRTPAIVKDISQQGTRVTLAHDYVSCMPANPVSVTIDENHLCQHGEACQAAAKRNLLTLAQACQAALAKNEITNIPDYLLEVAAATATRNL